MRVVKDDFNHVSYLVDNLIVCINKLKQQSDLLTVYLGDRPAKLCIDQIVVCEGYETQLNAARGFQVPQEILLVGYILQF